MGSFPLLASGRDADVYALDDHWVLRRYREGSGDAAGEAAVMAYVRERGVPVPEVYDASGTDLVYTFADIEAEELDIDGVVVPVATARVLFEMKRGTLRAQDRADAEALRKRFDLED